MRGPENSRSERVSKTRRRSAAYASYFLSCALAACQSDSEFVVAPDVDGPFFLIVQGEGRSPETSGPHRWEDQSSGFRFGVGGAARIHLLSVDLDQLLGPRLKDSAATLSQLELRLGDNTCPGPGTVDGGLELPLDESTSQLFELEGGKFAPRPLRDQPAAVWIPGDDPSCFGTPPLELVPFGRDLSLYPAEEVPAFLRGPTSPLQLRDLSDGRIAVAFRHALVLANRGESGPTRPEEVWATDSVAPLRDDGGSWWLQDFDLIETGTSADALEMALLLRWGLEPAPSQDSRIVELRWSPLGFEAPAERITTDTLMRFVATDGAGGWIAGGRVGQLYRRRRGEPEYTRVNLSRSVLEGVELRDWHPGWAEEEPDVLADTAGSLYFGTLDRPESFRAEFGMGSFEPPLVSLTRHDEGTELYWALGTPEFGHRSANGTRSVLSGYLPSEFAPCAAPPDSCGARSFVLGASSFLTATPDQTLVLASTSCSALVEYEPRLGCTRRVIERDRPVELVPRRINTVASTRGGLVVGGKDSALLYAPWSR